MQISFALLTLSYSHSVWDLAAYLPEDNILMKPSGNSHYLEQHTISLKVCYQSGTSLPPLWSRWSLSYVHYPSNYGQKVKTSGITDKSQAPNLDFGLSLSIGVDKDELSAVVV